MHVATVASLVQMEDPSTLMSLQTGLPKKRKFEVGRFQKRSEARGEKRMMPYQKPRGGRFRKPFRDFRGKGQWTPEQIETFRKEGKCFRCGKEGHVAAQCPEKPSTSRGTGTEKSQGPSKTTAGGIPAILRSNANPQARELLLTWGKICDQLMPTPKLESFY